jgi:hypothetical protein
VFPLSNWTELDIWQYIYLEGIPIVPLYFAAEREVIEKNGTLIMIDDERILEHLSDEDKRASSKESAFPYPWLLPVDGRGGVRGRKPHGHHSGNAPDANFRAPGPCHRPRWRRLDGRQETSRYF